MDTALDKYIYKEKIRTYLRFLIVLMAFYLGVIYLNLATRSTILALAAIAAMYAFLRDKLWAVFIVSVPALAFGQIIHIPLTPTWVYDATLSEAIITATAIVFLVHAFISNKLGEIHMDGIVMALLIYGCLSLASFFYIVDIQLYVAGMKIVTYSFLAYFLGINLIKSERMRDFAWNSIAATVIIFSLQIFHKFFSMGFSSKFFFDRSNILIPMGAIALVAAAIAMMLPAILAKFISSDKGDRRKYLFLAAFLAGSLAVVLTMGKGAILSLAAGLFYFLHFYREKRFVFIVSFLLFASLSYLFFTPYIEGLYERTISALRDTNIEFRLDEYETGWKIFRDHPLLGVGSGQQLAWYQKMIDPNYRNFANNFYLQAALDFGAVGIAAMSLIVIAVMLKLSRKKKELGADKSNAAILAGLIAGCVTAFINGMVEVTFFALPYAMIFWAMIGMAHGLKVRRV